MVYDQIVKLFSSPSLIKKQAERWLGTRPKRFDTNAKRLKELKKQQERVNQEEERYLKVYGSGLTSYEAFESQMKEVGSQREAFKTEINELESNIVKSSERPAVDIKSLCEAAVEAVKSFSLEDKQVFLRKIVTRVTANQESAVIQGYLPLMIGAKNVELQPEHSNSRDATQPLRAGKVDLNAEHWHRWSPKCREKYSL